MATPGSAQNFAIDVLRHLQQAGYTAYFAGGCVRDRLMGRPPKDFDVATNATPKQVLTLFPRSQKVGAAFGVMLIRHGREQVEVATFRADGPYSDGRHPDQVRFTTPEEDAQRRDFTCNGLFFDPLAANGVGQLHDYVGGQRDIAARILRAIGDPALRFAEDHLRLLRAVRFSARLGFTIDPATRAAMQRLQDRIASISRERVGEEIRLMLEHPARVAAVTTLAAFPALFRDVFAHAEPPIQWLILSGLPEKSSRPLALLAILQDLDQLAGADIPQHIAALRARLMLSNDETDALTWMAANLPRLWDWEDLSKAALKRMMASRCWKDLERLYCADPENAEQLFAFYDRIALMEDEGVSPIPFVTGDRLIAMGAQPGKSFKGWLETLYDRQLNGELTTPEEALAAAKTLLTQAV